MRQRHPAAGAVLVGIAEKEWNGKAMQRRSDLPVPLLHPANEAPIDLAEEAPIDLAALERIHSCPVALPAR